MKKFVIGDIHGGYKSLKQCFKRANFNYNNDKLFVLGDVCDGYPETKKCIDELLKIKHLEYIIGNHDLWALEWGKYDERLPLWLYQGGYNTVLSYKGKNMPAKHINFLEKGKKFVIDNNKLFVHGGFNPEIDIQKQPLETLIWDRDLIYKAKAKHIKNPNYKFSTFDDIFIGHTTTEIFHTLLPLNCCNVWDLDTGGGWSGKLTIMNVDTKEYWQSDSLTLLYPEEKRNIKEYKEKIKAFINEK